MSSPGLDHRGGDRRLFGGRGTHHKNHVHTGTLSKLHIYNNSMYFFLTNTLLLHLLHKLIGVVEILSSVRSNTMNGSCSLEGTLINILI